MQIREDDFFKIDTRKQYIIRRHDAQGGWFFEVSSYPLNETLFFYTEGGFFDKEDRMINGLIKDKTHIIKHVAKGIFDKEFKIKKGVFKEIDESNEFVYKLQNGVFESSKLFNGVRNFNEVNLNKASRYDYDFRKALFSGISLMKVVVKDGVHVNIKEENKKVIEKELHKVCFLVQSKDAKFLKKPDGYKEIVFDESSQIKGKINDHIKGIDSKKVQELLMYFCFHGGKYDDKNYQAYLKSEDLINIIKDTSSKLPNLKKITFLNSACYGGIKYFDKDTGIIDKKAFYEKSDFIDFLFEKNKEINFEFYSGNEEFSNITALTNSWKSTVISCDRKNSPIKLLFNVDHKLKKPIVSRSNKGDSFREFKFTKNEFIFNKEKKLNLRKDEDGFVTESQVRDNLKQKIKDIKLNLKNTAIKEVNESIPNPKIAKHKPQSVPKPQIKNIATIEKRNDEKKREFNFLPKINTKNETNEVIPNPKIVIHKTQCVLNPQSKLPIHIRMPAKSTKNPSVLPKITTIKEVNESIPNPKIVKHRPQSVPKPQIKNIATIEKNPDIKKIKPSVPVKIATQNKEKDNRAQRQPPVRIRILGKPTKNPSVLPKIHLSKPHNNANSNKISTKNL